MARTRKGTKTRTGAAQDSHKRRTSSRPTATLRRSICKGSGVAGQSRQAGRDVAATAGDGEEGKGPGSKDGEARRGKGQSAQAKKRESALYDALHEFGSNFNEEGLLADGYEEAFIGMVERCGQPSLACYDAEKCLEILMKRDGMTYEEAQSWFEFNTLGAWVGENTPVYLTRFRKEDWV